MARQIEDFRKIAPDYIQRCCLVAGMGPREVRSTLDKIPIEIREMVPAETVNPILAGQDPPHGFGLGGEGTGGGKTSALAAILKQNLLTSETRRVEAGGQPAFNASTLGLWWVSWPAQVTLLRTRAIQEGYVERVIEEMTETRILFLDDLGSERIKGSYVEDFAASQLDVIIDARYREEKPTFYTTNLNLAGLIEFYGARMVSRLCGDNPLYVVEGLKDQRFGR